MKEQGITIKINDGFVDLQEKLFKLLKDNNYDVFAIGSNGLGVLFDDIDDKTPNM